MTLTFKPPITSLLSKFVLCLLRNPADEPTNKWTRVENVTSLAEVETGQQKKKKGITAPTSKYGIMTVTTCIYKFSQR